MADGVSKSDDVRAALQRLEAELPPLDFSVEERRLVQVLSKAGAVDMLLRSQLMLEHKLMRLLERTGVTDDPNSSFPLRCRLARDLGLISELRFRSLYALNRVRNKFARNLDSSLTTEDVDAIASHIDVTERYEAVGADPRPLEQMRSLLLFLWTRVDSDVEHKRL